MEEEGCSQEDCQAHWETLPVCKEDVTVEVSASPAPSQSRSPSPAPSSNSVAAPAPKAKAKKEERRVDEDDTAYTFKDLCKYYMEEEGCSQEDCQAHWETLPVFKEDETVEASAPPSRSRSRSPSPPSPPREAPKKAKEERRHDYTLEESGPYTVDELYEIYKHPDFGYSLQEIKEYWECLEPLV
eukprot:TRINITY_DN14770_c1_g1_i1.p2 TRINITY_DN14770_c1_g1~~TRINITY_DN14770_c1_g1_i1.p2  ORF type:complete len:185 (+),score=25.90 TRINITY_DN14770_c1_g1_i1:709-1263(+)